MRQELTVVLVPGAFFSLLDHVILNPENAVL
jgi:hypothetical protein